MLSIFCSTEFSFKTPQNWAFFIWTFSLFSPHLSFNKPDLMFLFIVGRAGDLFSLLFFLIYYLFSFYFVLCVFQLFPLWNSFVHRWSWSQGSTLLRGKKKKKKKWCDVFYLQEALNEMKALASPCYSSSEKSYLNTWDTSWIGHCLLGGFLGLMSLQYSHSLIHLNTAGHLMLATASTLLSFLRGRLLK